MLHLLVDCCKIRSQKFSHLLISNFRRLYFFLTGIISPFPKLFNFLPLSTIYLLHPNFWWSTIDKITSFSRVSLWWYISTNLKISSGISIWESDKELVGCKTSMKFFSWPGQLNLANFCESCFCICSCFCFKYFFVWSLNLSTCFLLTWNRIELQCRTSKRALLVSRSSSSLNKTETLSYGS